MIILNSKSFLSNLSQIEKIMEEIERKAREKAMLKEGEKSDISVKVARR